MTLTTKEIAAINVMARWSRSNSGLIQKADACRDFDMSEPEYVPFMETMNAVGVLKNPASSSDGQYTAFSVGPRILDIQRGIASQIEEARTPDIVERLNKKAKANPIIARVIVSLVVLTFLATLANQIWGLVNKAIGKP